MEFTSIEIFFMRGLIDHMTSSDVHPWRLDGQLRHHVACRKDLLLAYPDLDDEMLADTLDGLTDLNEILITLVRSARDDESLASALSTRLVEMKGRLNRLGRRAKAKRSLVLNAMTKAELPRLVAAEFTISVRSGRATVDVLEEARIPEAYWIPQPPKLDRQKLLHDLRNGVAVAGARLASESQHLNVRVT
jgi:hypothetical protein